MLYLLGQMMMKKIRVQKKKQYTFERQPCPSDVVCCFLYH